MNISRVLTALLVLVVVNFVIFGVLAASLLTQLIVSAAVLLLTCAILARSGKTKRPDQFSYSAPRSDVTSSGEVELDSGSASELQVAATELSKKVDAFVGNLVSTRLELVLSHASNRVIEAADKVLDQLAFLLDRVKLTDSGSKTALESIWKIIDANFNGVLNEYVRLDESNRSANEGNLIDSLGKANERAQEMAENGFVVSYIDIALENPSPGPGREQAMTFLRQVRALSQLGREQVSLEDVKPGDYLVVKGDLHSVGQVSITKERYEGKDCQWFEAPVLNLRNGVSRFIEWERDDVLSVSLSTDMFNLAELGVTKSRLEQIRENGDGSIRYGGALYNYDDDGKATFYRGGGTEGEKFAYIDFETASGREFLGVEFWTGKEVQVHLSVKVNESEIRIFRPTQVPQEA